MHLDSLNPADAPVPRHEYHSDGEDADADALHSGTQDSRARLIAADVRIEWGSSSASPTLPLPAHSPVLIIADSLVRAFEHAHDPARCRARGRLLGRDHGQIYARLGVLDQGGLVVCLERRVRVAEAHPLAEGLLARLEELVGTGSEIIILDTYLPQTYVVLDTAPPAWTTPPVRYLRAGHTRSLARELESDAGSGASGSKARGMETGTTTLEPLQSPNYVSGFSAALLGAVARPSTSPSPKSPAAPSARPTTLLLLPLPAHPSSAAHALALLPTASPSAAVLQRAVGHLAREGDERRAEWDEGPSRAGEGERRGAKAPVAEIGEGGMYI